VGKDFERDSFLFGGNSVFIEELYQKYLENPNSVDPSWVQFFTGQTDVIPLKSTSKIIIKDKPAAPSSASSFPGNKNIENSLKARFMIYSYRENGHYLARLDPLGLEANKTKEELKLNLENFGFSNDNMAEVIDVSGELDGIKEITLGDLVSMLDRTYGGSVAAEFAHVENINQRKWLYDKLENANNHPDLSQEEKRSILQDLVEVEGFEQYLHTKFPGAKRFSVEGGDTSVICLDAVIEESAAYGAKEVVLGMSHRGRLSTLTKVLRKPYIAILSEFKGISAFPDDLDVSGDVKYHMGYSSDKKTKSGNEIHLSLTPNPSHLEAVNPVVAGKVRAKQDYLGKDRSAVVGILVHGDAAFCGQGVVAESLVMSGLKPYDVGGIFHLVINNQIGFTANAYDSRPGRYCTEVAKIVGAPILHVNGDDVEAVLLVTKIACEYRKTFGKDVVVDIVCYRKYGHNEGDEPMYTQSVMYNVIGKKLTPAALYSQKLIAENIVDDKFYPKAKEDFKKSLDAEFDEIANYKPRAQWLEGTWAGFDRSGDNNIVTGIDKASLKKLGTSLCDIPKSFALNAKLAKLFEKRVETLTKDEPIDWATAEQLAFGSLLSEKIPVRITGQDAGRGTFSHRHAVLHSQNDYSTYLPLNNISKDQGYFEIADSNLSEYGVLGFEYGYSLVAPQHLVIWEAQFGDFSNGAQIMFDQFISSGETKWLRMSGLVVLLPHGFEGQGPEHSSARLERFLQLAAEDNMYIVYPTTPASIFHLLRLQVKRNFRKPLIIMSPKSLLRHKLATSTLDEIGKDTKFIPVIDEIDADVKASDVKKVIFCSGKVYYDLLETRRENNIKNIAIVRLEQLYPFPGEMVVKVIGKYKNAKDFVWCQEEPKNMGAWKYIRSYMERSLVKANVKPDMLYIGRKVSASPAVGYLYVHNKQQEALAKEALGMLDTK